MTSEVTLGVRSPHDQWEPLPGQTIGNLFEQLTKEFLEASFGLLNHLRPGDWRYAIDQRIADFDQYAHLATLNQIVADNKELASVFGGDYIIKPDIVIARAPVSEAEINQPPDVRIVGPERLLARHTPLRRVNVPPATLILHASISCKWTLRSDRSQNTRTEVLNLICNRKGPLPHIVAVTAEPLPTRLAVLALGTGDLDCVYHIALQELHQALIALANEDQLDMLTTLVEGRRLRDISDLPFDLSI